MEKTGDSTGGEEPTRELPTAPTGGTEDRCTSCGAPLQHDQRYCVECGERRGQSRFPQFQPAAQLQTTQTRTVVPPRRRPTMSAGTTLVAGVGVLLLAIGLGFLIGHNNNNTNTQRAAASPQVITVQAGGGTGTGAASTAPTTTATGSTSKNKAKAKAAAKTSAAPPPAVQKKATEAAGKVLGNSKHLAPPTVTTGGSCSSGQAGCSGGKFNGNFFGN